MKTVAGFFGTQAGAVLMHYRRAATSEQASAQLVIRLRDLCEERDLLHRRQDSEIAERAAKLAECDAELERIKEKAAKLNALRDRLTLTLSSFWRRLGIWIRRLFSADVPSVGDLRDRLRDISRTARETEETLDSLVRKREKQAAELRRLTIPLESVEYAISFLERLQRSCRNEVRSHRSAIDAEIRAAVQSTGLLLLRGKLSALPASVERRPLAIRVLRLKSLLALLDLPAESDETAAAEVAGDPAQRVVDAVKQGFQAAAGRGRCQLPLRGEGRKHVRRTRTRLGTSSRPGHGGHRHTRRESYWDRVDVSMQGQLPIELDIPFPRWLPDSLVKTLRDEAHAWFHIGATREAADTARDRIARVRREAEALTHEIRDMLESVAARGG